MHFKAEGKERVKSEKLISKRRHRGWDINCDILEKRVIMNRIKG